MKKEEVELKPMLNPNEMIEHLKSKNIKFNKMSEHIAKEYLKYSNNYYNITSYKNNFEKYYIDGKIIDKYIDLDFAYLKDLSEIDYELRIVLFIMIMNIEHFLKIKILNEIETLESNGYDIVNEFLTSDFEEDKRVHKSIFHKMGSIYHKEIFSKYDLNKDKKLENIPVWEFLEIITFGELARFYEFFTIKHELKREKEDIYIFRDIVKLRNAVYHNTNILTNLNDKDNKYPQPFKVVDFLQKSNISIKIKNNKLSNSRIRQITYVLYMFNMIVADKKLKHKIKKIVKKLFYRRIKKHKKYYNNNDLLKSVYSYFNDIVSNNYK